MSYKSRLAAISAKAPSGRFAGSLLDERRWALRKSGIISGHLISDRLQGSVGCIVRDVSATGAKIQVQQGRGSVVTTPATLPDTFILVLEHEEIEVACAIAWRGAYDVGVRFSSPMKHLPKRPKRPLGKKKS